MIKNNIEMLKRGVEEIIPVDEFTKKLEESEKKNKPLIIKALREIKRPDLLKKLV